MNILSFDIEEWWSYEEYNLGEKKDYLPRLDNYLHAILDLLDEKKIQATFFCLGKVAEKYPKVIKSIAQRGHDIGCHSYSHQFFGDATYKAFFEDTKKALDIIENVIGKKVETYRAPAFSIGEKNKWAFEALIENGIKYDCSIFPAARSFGGFKNFQKKPCLVEYQGETIKEFPISPATLLGKEVVYSGGGYFRLVPYPFIKYLVQKNQYMMSYFHLYDFDKERVMRFSSFKGKSALISYLKKSYGVKGSFKKFKRLLWDFEFVSVKQADEELNWEDVPKVVLR